MTGSGHTSKSVVDKLSRHPSDSQDSNVQMLHEKHDELFKFHRTHGFHERGSQGCRVLVANSRGQVQAYDISFSEKCVGSTISRAALSIPDSVDETVKSKLVAQIKREIGQHTNVEKHVLATAKVIARCHSLDATTGPKMQAGFTIVDGAGSFRRGYIDGNAAEVAGLTQDRIREMIEWLDVTD